MALSPLNESGSPVDWWFLYKVPKITKGDTPATGYEYAYYDDPSENVVQSQFTLDSDQGALHATLDGIFNGGGDSVGWILYNDEKPNGTRDNGQLGHTKGVLAFDLATDSAVWLLHSWPKYVEPGADGMPTPMFGQTFMCVALDLAGARALASQMITHQQPQVFDPKLPEALAADDPLRLLAGRIDPNDPGDALTIDLTTRGGLKFKVIAKNRGWGKDFWNELVGPKIGEDINVETWIRGKNVIPSTEDSDGIHTVSDIKYITLQQLGMPWAWPETKDHAKWAISHADDWICVGDINRMISQEQRGGCTIAFQDATLWALLNKTDLLNVPDGMTKTDAINQLQSTHTTGRPAVTSPSMSFFQDHAHTTPAGLNFRARPSKQSFASVVGTIDQNTERAITGRSGDHLQFYVEVGNGARYQVDVNTQSRDGSPIEVSVQTEALTPAGTNPSEPFGSPSLGVFPDAALSYKGIGLTDDDFSPLAATRIEGQLEAALNQAEFVAIYGMVFDDGGANGKGIHETHFTGRSAQDGGLAIYMKDPSTGAPSRTWYFFKFQEDDVANGR